MTRPPLPEDSLPPCPDLPPGRYRHYKGGLYDVIAVARHSETLEALVVYRSVEHPDRWWVRPCDLFIGQVTVGDTTVARFSRTG